MGGIYKGKMQPDWGVWLQWYCHLVIQKHTLGSSTKPQTLYLDYLSASHVGSINWNYSVTYFVNFVQNTGSIGEFGRCWTFFLLGPQIRVLADEDGGGIEVVYHLPQ